MPKNTKKLAHAIKDHEPRHYEKTTVCFVTKFTPSQQFRLAKQTNGREWEYDTTSQSQARDSTRAFSSFQTVKTLGRSGDFLKSAAQKRL